MRLLLECAAHDVGECVQDRRPRGDQHRLALQDHLLLGVILDLATERTPPSREPFTVMLAMSPWRDAVQATQRAAAGVRTSTCGGTPGRPGAMTDEPRLVDADISAAR